MPEQNTKDKQDVAAARRHWINYLERNQSVIVQVNTDLCPVNTDINALF